MHCAHIGESTACIAHGKFRARRTLEKEQARITLVGIGSFLLLGVNIVKDGLAVQGTIA